MTESATKVSGSPSSTGVDVAVATGKRATKITATIISLLLHEGIFCSLISIKKYFLGSKFKEKKTSNVWLTILNQLIGRTQPNYIHFWTNFKPCIHTNPRLCSTD